MNAENDPIKRAHAILRTAMEQSEAALLTTASADGIPHATWMATMTALDFRGLLTLTSPDSRKVSNIKSNPRVEWLFTDARKEGLVYLEGTATVLDDIATLKEAWERIPHKERAFFLASFNSKPGFAVIETRIESVTYCVPAENRKVDIDPGVLATEAAETGGRTESRIPSDLST